jgi:hypothetical protein
MADDMKAAWAVWKLRKGRLSRLPLYALGDPNLNPRNTEPTGDHHGYEIELRESKL